MANLNRQQKETVFGGKNLIARIKALTLLPRSQLYEQLNEIFVNPIPEESEIVQLVSSTLMATICAKQFHMSIDEINIAMVDKDAGERLQSKIEDFIMRRNGNLLTYDNIDIVANALNAFIDTHLSN
jgi:hypothetical protein